MNDKYIVETSPLFEEIEAEAKEPEDEQQEEQIIEDNTIAGTAADNRRNSKQTKQ